MKWIWVSSAVVQAEGHAGGEGNVPLGPKAVRNDVGLRAACLNGIGPDLWEPRVNEHSRSSPAGLQPTRSSRTGERTASTFLALKEEFTAQGLPVALYTDRGSHYFHTPEADSEIDSVNALPKLTHHAPPIVTRPFRLFLPGRLVLG